jgi:Fe-S-cluster-containing hydrogenase component 2
MLKLILMLPVLATLKWIYQVDPDRCTGCSNCVYFCPQGAISMNAGKAWIDPELCDGCGTCVAHCPWGAIYMVWYEGTGDSAPESPSLSANPAAQSVHVTGLPKGSDVVLSDLAGRTRTSVAVDPSGGVFFDLSALPSGLYMIRAGDAVVLPLVVTR